MTDVDPTGAPAEGADAGPGAAPDAAAPGPAAPTAQAVLEYLARSVVEHPEAVRVEVEPGRGGSVTLNLHVADGDLGRVIGKRGRVAQAVRTVVRAAAVRDDVAVNVEFVD